MKRKVNKKIKHENIMLKKSMDIFDDNLYVKKPLNSSNKLFFKINEKDKLSELFEKTFSHEKRYKLGQYFTPRIIIDYIINSIPIKNGDKILDPTCGAGAFLRELIDTKLTSSENIYGSDVDNIAINLCLENIKGRDGNLILGDFIKEDLFLEKSFDVIIGNPPFKNISFKSSLFGENEKSDKPLFKRTNNLASLVLIKSYFLLKEGGYLGLVLPKNFIRVDSFKEVREFVLKNMEIILIKDLDHHFKEVRGDQIILIARKKKPSLNHNVKIIPFKKNISFGDQEEYTLLQNEFFNYPFFPVFYNDKIKPIADKLFSIKNTLIKEAEIFRGSSFNFFKPFISTTNKSQFTLLRGNCIQRFGLKYELFFKENVSKIFILEKTKRSLREKIVIQNLPSKEGGVFPMISNKNQLTVDTVTNIIPHNKEYLFFLEGLLGSKLCNFFMIHLIYLNSNFSMHTDSCYIGKIPIIYPDKETNNEIKKIVQSLNLISNKYSDEFKLKYAELNRILYTLYNLNKEEIKVIEDSLKEVMSKKNG